MPVLIGIAGPSGSGKTALAKRLIHALPGTVSLLSLDSYYRELSHLQLADRERVNFDHPDSIDWDLFERHLALLASGTDVEEPVYLFAEHNRAGRTIRVRAADYVLAEGILVLHREQVRRLLSLKVYVLTPDEVCYRRRLDRDVRERGRTPHSVEAQYASTVKPMAEQFVWPAREFADLVVSGQEPFDVSIARVLDALRVG
ncbi:MAG: uridine kinase [Acidobacteria bacterium]|nr:uridine kinase [Acidobacteriota bacterium]